MNRQRLLALAGPAFVAVALVGAIGVGGSTPESDASASEVAAFYTGDLWRQAIAALLLAASVPFLIVFAIELSGRGADPGRSPWPQLLVGGSIVTGAMLVMTAAIHFALADAGSNDFSPTVLQTLNVLDGDTWVAWNAGLGVTMLGAAGCLWSRTGAERWLGRLAVVLGILLFVPFADFFALLVSLVWIVVVGFLRAARDPGVAEDVVPVAAT
jgi:hypothetical protein